jgi:hypothetical protein
VPLQVAVVTKEARNKKVACPSPADDYKLYQGTKENNNHDRGFERVGESKTEEEKQGFGLQPSSHPSFCRCGTPYLPTLTNATHREHTLPLSVRLLK